MNLDLLLIFDINDEAFIKLAKRYESGILFHVELKIRFQVYAIINKEFEGSVFLILRPAIITKCTVFCFHQSQKGLKTSPSVSIRSASYLLFCSQLNTCFGHSCIYTLIA